MGRAENKELRRVTSTSKRRSGLCCVFGFGIFSTAKALRPWTCWCPEVAFVSCHEVQQTGTLPFVFVDGKTPGEAVNVCRDGSDSFPGRRGRSLPEYTPVLHRSLQHFNTPTVIYFGLPVAALSLTGSVGTHYNCLFNYFSWMLHLHFTKWTPETEVQLSPTEQRGGLFKQRGGRRVNTFLVLKVTSKWWQWEGSQGAISYLFVLWFDLSLDKVPELITVSVLRSNRGPLHMFSRLEEPDVGER